MFYNSYILPILDYCCIIWGKSNRHYVNKVSVLQKRFDRLILAKPSKSPSDELLKELSWLTLTNRCKYHAAVLIYKTLNNSAPNYMLDIIQAYSLRSETNNDLVLIKTPRRNIYKDSLSYYSVCVWNNIPQKSEMSPTLLLLRRS